MKPPAMMKVGMASSTMVLMPLKPTGKVVAKVPPSMVYM